MTVSELVKALQDCDKPDARAVIRVHNPDEESKDITDIYYTSVLAGEVIIEASI